MTHINATHSHIRRTDRPKRRKMRDVHRYEEWKIAIRANRAKWKRTFFGEARTYSNDGLRTNVVSTKKINGKNLSKWITNEKETNATRMASTHSQKPNAILMRLLEWIDVDNRIHLHTSASVHAYMCAHCVRQEGRQAGKHTHNLLA